ncbi:aldose 1-epimerase [Uliginosibacterium sediminicola]|uniref:Aldose 1-epimerase n=1 Tax=Uliginosibacterium sediminicola TaxID=2024550 RepID=A0ABU9YYK4_9RHOO
MSDPVVLNIETSEQRLGLMPELGGSVAYWEIRRDGEWKALWRPYAPEVDGRRFVGNLPLVPFSNRITGGGITVDGVFYPMAPNRFDPVPIHGTGWMHTWDVREHSAQAIELSVTSLKKHGYPWEYASTQRYSLTEDSMTMLLEVEHLGDKPLPYGLAWHPFQLRGDDPQGPRLQFKADGYWASTPEGIAAEHIKGLPEGWDFNTLKPLGHGKIDNNFSGWDGKMIMERDDIDLHLEWETTQPAGLETSILFRPEGQPFFCFEPITHITDAFHRPGMPGLKMLAKGERMTLEVVQKLSRIKR